MKKIDNVVIHCSDSNFGDAALIDKWHKEKGWRGIGYHYVILNGMPKAGKPDPKLDGAIQAGRSLDNDTWIDGNEVGAHALGFNDNSIGICLIGGQSGSKTAFTINQYFSLLLMVGRWKRQIRDLKVLGHNETGAAKACPVINMDLFRERLTAFLEGGLSFALLKIDIEKRGV